MSNQKQTPREKLPTMQGIISPSVDDRPTRTTTAVAAAAAVTLTLAWIDINNSNYVMNRTYLLRAFVKCLL